jgi:NADP-reducing hydrogenase subunit HndB
MNLEELRKIRERAQAEMRLRGGTARVKIVVGMGTSGIAAGARVVMTTLLDEIEKRRLTDVIVTQSGERGFASQEPVVEVIERNRSNVLYGAVNQSGARRIVAEHIVNGTIVEDLVLSVTDVKKE